MTKSGVPRLGRDVGAESRAFHLFSCHRVHCAIVPHARLALRVKSWHPARYNAVKLGCYTGVRYATDDTSCPPENAPDDGSRVQVNPLPWGPETF
jgi:hypothetical protein